jgi:hypothetical protein
VRDCLAMGITVFGGSYLANVWVHVSRGVALGNVQAFHSYTAKLCGSAPKPSLELLASHLIQFTVSKGGFTEIRFDQVGNQQTRGFIQERGICHKAGYNLLCRS